MVLYRWFILSFLALALPALCSFAAGKHTTIVFEAEHGIIETHKSFRVQKSTEDPGIRASGGKVVAIPKIPIGERVKEDRVAYHVTIPREDTYYLWIRTYWSAINDIDNDEIIFHNKLGVSIQGDATDRFFGGDATYEILHWVALRDRDQAWPLKLKKGITTITLKANDPGIRIDQLLLTTDAKFMPAGVYPPTLGALVNDVSKSAVAAKTIVFEAENGVIETKQSFRVSKMLDDPTGYVSGNKVLAIPRVSLGERVKSDAVRYDVVIPKDGTYYLWIRAWWSMDFDDGEREGIFGNTVGVSIESYTEYWVIGGDGVLDVLHWVYLRDADKPRPLKLRKGVNIIKLLARESGVKIDQLLLTTDVKFVPTGIYPPTPNSLAITQQRTGGKK